MTEKLNIKQLKPVSTDVNLGNSDVLLPTQKAVKDYVDTTASGLQSEIDDLKGLGRFLSVWNCATGLAETNPPTSPYTYNSGDYFLVGTVDSTTNYKPDGSSYTTGVASTTVETDTVKVNDVYIYDGTTWKLQANVQRDVVFSAIQGDPYDNTALSNALGDKVDETSTANQVYGTDNNGDQTTYNITDFGAVDDVQVDGVSVVTSKVANINLSNYVTLSTTQAITGTKTFKAEILSWNNITFESAQANPIIRGMSGASYRNMITRTNSASAIDVGNTSDKINLKGSGTRPTYNSNDLALYSDIPTVNDATLTIQKNGTDIDTFTANSATNKTVNITVPTTPGDIGAQAALTAGTNIQITGTTISATDTTYSNFTGATAGDAGASGLVPAPAAGDQGKFLQGDGTWANPTIPTVNDATITITQGGVTKGSFTLNQASGDTIALDAGGGSSLPSQTGHAGEFLTTDGTDASWSDKPLVNKATGTKSLSVLGTATTTNCSTNIGVSSGAGVNGTACGYNSSSGIRGVAIGYQTASGPESGIGIGFRARSNALRAIQLGSAKANADTVNSDANTFKVANTNGNFEIMSADGTIPEARLASTASAAQGQVLTLDSNLNAVWAATSVGDIDCGTMS